MKYFYMACVAGFALSGCGVGPSPDANSTTEQTEKEAQPVPSIPLKAAREETSEVTERSEKVVARSEARPPSMCFVDYCPCEPDIDNNGIEEGLCRSLRGGVAVEDQLMSGAAMMRDARRQMREFEARPSDY